MNKCLKRRKVGPALALFSGSNQLGKDLNEGGRIRHTFWRSSSLRKSPYSVFYGLKNQFGVS
jgi:hypothetical protein